MKHACGIATTFVLLLPALAASAETTHDSQPPGRLFFTPEQRVAMDQGKTLGQIIHYNGMLHRKGRTPQIWVDGQLLDSSSMKSLNIMGLSGQTLILQAGEKTVRLKPGQRYDRASGKVWEFGEHH